MKLTTTQLESILLGLRQRRRKKLNDAWTAAKLEYDTQRDKEMKAYSDAVRKKHKPRFDKIEKLKAKQAALRKEANDMDATIKSACAELANFFYTDYNGTPDMAKPRFEQSDKLKKLGVMLDEATNAANKNSQDYPEDNDLILKLSFADKPQAMKLLFEAGIQL